MPCKKKVYPHCIFKCTRIYLQWPSVYVPSRRRMPMNLLAEKKGKVWKSKLPPDNWSVPKRFERYNKNLTLLMQDKNQSSVKVQQDIYRNKCLKGKKCKYKVQPLAERVELDFLWEQWAGFLHDSFNTWWAVAVFWLCFLQRCCS